MSLIPRVLFSLLLMIPHFASALGSDENEPCVKYLTTSSIDNLLLELPEKSRIPDYAIETTRTNEVSRALVKRIRRKEMNYSPRESRKPVDLISEADIILFIKPKNILSVIEHGFLTAFQTGQSHGGLDAIDLDLRAGAENSIVGLDLGRGKKAEAFRPKSAFLNIRSHVDLAGKFHWMAHQFGGCGAVFKRNVKDRAIWLSGDSLSIGQGQELNGNLISSIQEVSGTFDSASLPDKSGDPGYYESLVFGSLAIEDVEYFLALPDCVSAALMTGKPVYEMNSQRRNNRFVFEKGKCLSPRCLSAK